MRPHRWPDEEHLGRMGLLRRSEREGEPPGGEVLVFHVDGVLRGSNRDRVRRLYKR